MKHLDVLDSCLAPGELLVPGPGPLAAVVQLAQTLSGTSPGRVQNRPMHSSVSGKSHSDLICLCRENNEDEQICQSLRAAI